MHRFASLALKSRIDAAMEASGVLQAELFFFAATEIRIGCGIPLSPRLLQAEPFFFAATKIRIGYGRSLSLQSLQAEPFFFAATKNRIRRGPLSRYGRCRRNHSSLRQQKKQNRTRRIAAVPGLNQEKPCSDSQVWASTNESMPNGHF